MREKRATDIDRMISNVVENDLQNFMKSGFKLDRDQDQDPSCPVCGGYLFEGELAFDEDDSELFGQGSRSCQDCDYVESAGRRRDMDLDDE